MQDLLGVLFFAVQVDALPPDDTSGQAAADFTEGTSGRGAGQRRGGRGGRNRGRDFDVEREGRSLLGALLDPDFIEHDAYLLFAALMVHAWPLFDMETVRRVEVDRPPGVGGAADSAGGAAPSGGSASSSSAADVPPATPLCFSLCNLAQRSVLPLLDAALAAKLQRLEVEPTMYMVKWLLPLFRRELPTRGVLRLWDALLASCLAARLDKSAPSSSHPGAGRGGETGSKHGGYPPQTSSAGALTSSGSGVNFLGMKTGFQKARKDFMKIRRGFEDGVNQGKSSTIQHMERLERGLSGAEYRSLARRSDGKVLALTHGAFISAVGDDGSRSLQPCPMLSTAVLIAVAMLQRSLGEPTSADGGPSGGGVGGGGGDGGEVGGSRGSASEQSKVQAHQTAEDLEFAAMEARLQVMQVLMSGYTIRSPSDNGIPRREAPLSDATRARLLTEASAATANFAAAAAQSTPTPVAAAAAMSLNPATSSGGKSGAEKSTTATGGSASGRTRHQSFARVGWSVPADAESSGGGDGDSEAIAILKTVASMRDEPRVHLSFAQWSNDCILSGGRGEAAPLLAWHTGLSHFMRNRVDERLGFGNARGAAVSTAMLTNSERNPTDLRTVASLLFDPCSRALVVCSSRGPPRPLAVTPPVSSTEALLGDRKRVESLLCDATRVLASTAAESAAAAVGEVSEVVALRAEVTRLLSLVSMLSAGHRPSEFLERSRSSAADSTAADGSRLGSGSGSMHGDPSVAAVSAPAHDWHVVVTQQRRGLGALAPAALQQRIVLSVGRHGIETRDERTNKPVHFMWKWSGIEAVANSSSDAMILKVVLKGAEPRGGGGGDGGGGGGGSGGGKGGRPKIFVFASALECSQTFQRIMLWREEYIQSLDATSSPHI